MSITTPGAKEAAGGRLLVDYQQLEGVYDEMLDPHGAPRPHWRPLLAQMAEIGGEELDRLWRQAERLVRDNGVMYHAYGEPLTEARPWELDPLPLVLSAQEWGELSAGLVQRARLLNRVVADLYGPQQLFEEGLLPPELVFSHPGFARVFHGQRVPEDCYLHLYAADLARAPDGRWWVVGDRTDAPLGMGYALENRIVVSRAMPNVIRQTRVQRLAPFFIALREALQRLAPTRRENPRIVLLSQGPGGPNYFEDSYLARYLGLTLVESEDLTVREERVCLKTLAGLLPVDVIFRRLSDLYCDPLEIRVDEPVGIPGLLEAVRSGQVAVANALGSSLVESPAFMPFLPGLCERLLGEPLRLPSLATWWCGQAAAREIVGVRLPELMLRSAYRLGRLDPIAPDSTSSADPPSRLQYMRAHAAELVAQEPISRSTAPVWKEGGAAPQRIALRVFLVAGRGTWQVLPGGLVRLAEHSGELDRSVTAGNGSKDAWVLSEGPVKEVSLLQSAGHVIDLRRTGAELPSRVADHLFWLGRHTERAATGARILRALLQRLTSEAKPDQLPEVTALLRVLAGQGVIEPGFVISGIREQLPSIDSALPAAVFDRALPGSLVSTIHSAYHNAGLVRDRISLDAWRIIHRLEFELAEQAQRGGNSLGDLLERANAMIFELAALDGIAGESMTRTQAWRFLDLGRRLERSLQTIALVECCLFDEVKPSGSVFEVLLEVTDSIMTYRSRYLASWHAAALLDLLLTDETNPRSLAFQLAVIADHVDRLPRESTQPLLGPEQRIARAAIHQVQMLDREILEEATRSSPAPRLLRTLTRLSEQLPKLSDLISHKYLVHAGLPRPMSGEPARGSR